MDQTDYHILNLLQRDGRITLKRLGGQVGLSAPAVSERVRRMEDQGVIHAFYTEINRRKLGCHMIGFIFVAVEPGQYEPFCQFCQGHPAIFSHYHIIGVFNALLRFAVPDTYSLERLLSQIKQYGDSQTSISLETYFEGKDIPPLWGEDSL